MREIDRLILTNYVTQILVGRYGTTDLLLEVVGIFL